MQHGKGQHVHRFDCYLPSGALDTASSTIQSGGIPAAGAVVATSTRRISDGTCGRPSSLITVVCILGRRTAGLFAPRATPAQVSTRAKPSSSLFGRTRLTYPAGPWASMLLSFRITRTLVRREQHARPARTGPLLNRLFFNNNCTAVSLDSHIDGRIDC